MSVITADHPNTSRYAAIARVAPFVTYILFLALGDVLAEWLTPLGLDARWLYAVRVGLVLALLLVFARYYQELKWSVTKPGAKAWLVSVAIGVVVFVLWVMPWPQWAQTEASGGFNPLRDDGSMDLLLATVRFTGAALIVPIMEELFWRSFLLRWIKQQDFLNVDPAKVGWLAFTIVVVLFGVEHSLWLAGMVAGVAYTALYMVYRNLWTPIIAHAVTNGLLGIWVLNTANWQYW